MPTLPHPNGHRNAHPALDLKTVDVVRLKQDYRASTKRNMPKRWFDKLPHTHQALDEALEQGALFCHMLAEWKSR